MALTRFKSGCGFVWVTTSPQAQRRLHSLPELEVGGGHRPDAKDRAAHLVQAHVGGGVLPAVKQREGIEDALKALRAHEHPDLGIRAAGHAGHLSPVIICGLV